MKPPSFRLANQVPRRAKVLGVPVYSDLLLPPAAGAELDRRFLQQRRFEGRPGQALALPADDGTTVVALGVGAKQRVDADVLRRAGAALAREAGSATEIATTLSIASSDQALIQAVVEGIGLGAYRFRSPNGAAAMLESVTVVAPDPRSIDARAAMRRGESTLRATWRARDWVNRPARDLTPTRFAEDAWAAAQAVGLDVEIWDEDRIAKEKLGCLLGVASGAAEPPRVIRLFHDAPSSRSASTARGKDRKPAIALVGKGITFDSGGLSLKTAQGMMTMKGDMGGAAAVIAATVALAELEVPVRVSSWVAATENMPGAAAIHPGDVLTARNQKTIEVLNTDAEGRLVLADVLSLAVEEQPDAIVDIATLTGGQRVALGVGVSAVMGSDAGLVRRVIEAGRSAGEPAWELPLVDAYRKQLDSEVADMRNVSPRGDASAIMAGLVLREFTGGLPWAHLDTAAPNWSDGDDGWLTKGATGWGARTLVELVTAWPSDRAV